MSHGDDAWTRQDDSKTMEIDRIKISKKQIRFNVKQEVKLELHRDYKGESYEINIRMPWGEDFNLSAADFDYNRVLTKYKEIARKLRGGAVIEISKFSEITIKEE